MSLADEVKVQNVLKRSLLYERACEVVRRLQGAGFSTLIAGGAVRDALLGRPIKDLDIATEARPEEVERVFEDVIEIGRPFGVMGVKLQGAMFEVTTFRSDGDYADGRRPQTVQFADIHSDCLRRDFTINALYFDPVANRLIDLVDGRKDLDRHLIRTVGQAEVRFGEDHLRILRAFRFASVLGFDVESETLSSASRLSDRLRLISKERITAEFEKLVTGKAVAKALILARPTAVLSQVLGFDLSVDEFHDTLKMMELTPRDLIPRISALLRAAYESKKVVWDDLFARFRFSQIVERGVRHCYAIHERLLDENLRMGERLKSLGEEMGLQSVELDLTFSAIHGGTRPDLEVLLEKFSELTEGTGELPRPCLTPQNLMENGVKPGLLFGQILKEAYLLQLEGHLRTHKEALDFLLTFRS